MKWYKVCNRISLLLHALCSTAGYFLIEAISRHSFSAAWTYMTTKPLIFAYNAALIFTTSLLVYLFRKRCFWRVLIAILWLLLGIVKHELHAGALGGLLYIQRIADAPGAFPAELGKAQQHRVLRRLFLRGIFPRGAAGQREREQRERQKNRPKQRGSETWAHEDPSRDEKIFCNSILMVSEPNCKRVSARG